MKVLSDVKELKGYFNDEDLLVEFGGTSTFKYKYPFDDEDYEAVTGRKKSEQKLQETEGKIDEIDEKLVKKGNKDDIMK